MENFMEGSAARNDEAEGPTDAGTPAEAAEKKPSTLRDRLGRFLPGNLGGPGNPHARRVALLRNVILDRVPPDKLAVLVDEMYDMALNGDAAMAKVLLSYLLGKPSASGDPDRIEVEEWKLRQEQPRLEEVAADRERVPAVLANEMGQYLDPRKEQAFLAAPPPMPEAKRPRERQASRAKRRQEKKEARRRRKHSG